VCIGVCVHWGVCALGCVCIGVCVHWGVCALGCVCIGVCVHWGVDRDPGSLCIGDGMDGGLSPTAVQTEGHVQPDAT
jgi:hypothetical protein